MTIPNPSDLPEISRRLLIRCYERLGGMNPLEAFKLSKMLTPAFEKATKAIQNEKFISESLGGKPIAVIAITESNYHGLAMAYLSGLAHRVSPSHARWRAVHSPTLLTQWDSNPHEAVVMNTEEALDFVEPHFLGASVEGLFDPRLKASYDPEAPSLFVYPENALTPKFSGRVTDEIVKRPDISSAIIITKYPVILTDFFGPCVTVITTEKEEE